MPAEVSNLPANLIPVNPKATQIPGSIPVTTYEKGANHARSVWNREIESFNLGMEIRVATSIKIKIQHYRIIHIQKCKPVEMEASSRFL